MAKSKLTVISRKEVQIQTLIDEEFLEQVAEYKYLGVTICRAVFGNKTFKHN